MTDPTPDDLATLARAMGYTVTLDDSGGYGVVRVIYEYQFHGVTLRAAFNPTHDAAQAWEVMAWLMNQKPLHYFDGDERQSWFELLSAGIYKMVFCEGEHIAVQSWMHYGTAAGIRRAVVEAAIRVAKG